MPRDNALKSNKETFLSGAFLQLYRNPTLASQYTRTHARDKNSHQVRLFRRHAN